MLLTSWRFNTDTKLFSTYKQDLLFPTLIIQEESTKTKNIFFEHKKNIPCKSKYHFKFQSVYENLCLKSNI